MVQQPGITIIGESFYHFDPGGVSGLVLVSGSHISIHTWPEYGYAALDIFTCSDDFSPDEAARMLIEKLEAKDPSIAELERGP